MVSAAYDAGQWGDFAVGVAGASAALGGLLFVAVSINLERILRGNGLPARAAETLLLLLLPVLASVFLLVPGQPESALAAELLVTGVAALVALVMLALRSRLPGPGARSWWLTRLVPAVAVGLCLAVAGGSLNAGTGGGLYWCVPAVVVALLAGVTNAWVLLVEILR